MKTTVYMRVAKNQSGKPKVAANVRPSDEPLKDGYGNALPTVSFAVAMVIDEKAFRAAENVIARMEITESALDVAAGTTVDLVEP